MFRVLRSCFPRYVYTAGYVERLSTECKTQLNECGLSLSLTCPEFGDVFVYVHPSLEKHVTEDHIAFKKIEQGLQIQEKKVAKDDIIKHPTILVVAASEQSVEGAGDFDFTIKVSTNETPDCNSGSPDVDVLENCDTNTTPSRLAKQICDLLEGYAISHLDKWADLLNKYYCGEELPNGRLHKRKHNNKANGFRNNGFHGQTKKVKVDEKTSLVLETAHADCFDSK